MDEILQDNAAEKAVLSGIIKHGSTGYLDVKDIISYECFSPANSVIFSAIDNIFQKNPSAVVDLPSIYSSAKEIGLNECLNDNGKYISSLFGINVELSNIRSFAIKLKKLYHVKQLIGKFDETVTHLRKVTGSENLTEISAIAEKPIFDFLTNLTTDGQQIQQVGHEVDSFLDNIKNSKDDLAGIDINFPIWQKVVGGLHSGVHVIGARKKCGKSFVCSNAALYASAIKKIKVLYLDTEMRLHSGGYTRFLTRLSDGVEQNEIKYGTYLDDEIKIRKVDKAARILKSIPLDYLNITGKNFDEVISIIRRWINQKVGYDKKGKLNKCLVVYDYLKISDSNALKEATEWQLLGFNMSKLHDISELYGFPILTCVQMNREFSVAASDRISWLAVSYSSMYKKTPDEIGADPYGNIRLVPEDSRFGELLEDGDYINLTLNGKLAKMTEGKTRNQITKEKESIKCDDEGDY